MVHRAWQGFVVARTTCINRIRGLRGGFGIARPLNVDVVRHPARNHLEELPGFAKLVIGDLLSEVAHLDERIKQYDVHIRTMTFVDGQRLDQRGERPLVCRSLWCAGKLNRHDRLG